MSADLARELEERILVLSEKLWEHRVRRPDIQAWLSNFDGRHLGDVDREHLHALHLLSHVSYFGLRELNVLLRALYRDLFRYRLVQEIRDRLSGTRYLTAIGAEFQKELDATRFLGIGSPAESGTYLLYFFRQENRLAKLLFPHQHELFTSAISDPACTIAGGVKRIVFIDDFCASGDQAISYGKRLATDIRTIAARGGGAVELQYLVLFGTEKGLQRARDNTEFDVIEAVNEIDETYQTFEAASRVYRRTPPSLARAEARVFAEGYGKELWAQWPLGYKNGQLLLGFHHNVPDNSIPLLWWDQGTPPWAAIMPRRHKK